MFQIPVENLDNIRKVRKKVKSILVDIGLDSCKGLLKDLKGFDPGEKYFCNTSWGDISLWEPSGKKVRYRTKPYCCSLCKYSTKVITSFRSHLHRYHEDELDQELVIPCPSCVFSSQPKVVGRHFKMFHAPVRKVQHLTVDILGEARPPRSDVISFTCLKCNFSSTLYYSMKKHVLVAHFHHLVSAYFGQRTEETEPAKTDEAPLEKVPPSDRYFCKKCHAGASSQDALMYHILTADVHRDLENKLRSVISEHAKKAALLKPAHIAPKPAVPLAVPPGGSAPGLPTGAPCFHLALQQPSPSPAVVRPVQSSVQPVTVASGASGNPTCSPPAGAPPPPPPRVTLVSSPLPVPQSSLALQPSAPQPVFLSPGVPLAPSANPPVLPVSQAVGTGVLPIGQAIRPGGLPLSQPVGPGVLSVSRPVASRVLPVSPSVTPGVLQAVSPGVISVGRTVPSGVLPAGQMTPAGVIPSGQTATSGVLPAGQVAQSGVLPSGLPAPARVLPPGQPVPLRVLPPGQGVPPGLLSPSQTVAPAVLPVNPGLGSGVLQLSQPVVSGVLPVGQPGRPGVLQLSQPVSPGVLPAGQPVRPGASQGTAFLTSGSILRQLIPTGKQVNGIPTYTLAPVSVTLPVPPGGVATVGPPQVPIQLLQSSAAAQMASPVAGVPSPPVVNATQTTFTQASSSASEASQALKQAKQWKTCPVCNELFPSNVYQVHMEVAHKHSEAKAAEKLEPEKLAACAPFLKWVREKTVRCLSCKCLVPEDELMRHLLLHGLGCLFCPCTFHDIRGLAEHSRTMHLGKKKLPVDYSNRGFQLDIDSNGSLLFPHLDFITILPREALGEREVYLAVLAGIHSKSLVPVYIKVRPQGEGAPGSPQPALTCPFCFGSFVTPEAYELHLKERHHITPTVHTILKSPAFKCIHCCGVYTGNMTLAAIAVHLLRCRSAPKDSSSDLQARPGLVEDSELLWVSGEGTPDSGLSAKRKLPDGHFGADDQRAGEERPLLIPTEVVPPEKGAAPPKRQRNESRVEGPPASEDPLQILALNPKKYEDRSYEEKKRFLRDYFHKRPYPSKKEIELLSSLLWVWKIDVASFFGKRRYICMKAIKNHKPSVLLGFDMSELKHVKHRLNFESESQDL